jgi:hypothetical protein
MVGFGSSLRMARRPGWEGAYVDYEMLKLLLSQIEAVYEEEGQSGFDSRQRRRDYRDELFLESDSDVAYLSPQSTGLDSVDTNTDFSDKKIPEKRGQQATPGQQPFTLHYSREASSSSEEELEDPGCGTRYLLSSWKTEKTSNTSYLASETTQRSGQKGRRKAKSGALVATPEDDGYYVTTGRAAGSADAFILAGEDQLLIHDGDGQQPSILSAPVRQTTSSAPAGFFSFGTTTVTPPRRNSAQHDNHQHVDSESAVMLTSSKKNNVNSKTSSTTKLQKSPGQLSEARKRERRLRRLKRQQLLKSRRRQQRKVPLHLRVAHAKARAITERFLGFLRAETEKVMLFCQSRLGELADTAGSLRFPAFDDDNHNGPSSVHSEEQQKLTSHHHYGEYRLSDGGMHPSASSSSDEGATGGGQGIYPWSDSSDEEEEGQESPLRGGASSISKALSAGGAFSDDSIGRSARPNRSHQGEQHQVTVQKSVTTSTKVSNNRRDLESIAAVRRQMKHFTSVRQTRGTFQRSDQILGEDMLFMSAVEEADGYTAVGVELMHVLRYICVNVIAVRKICRKHDRLLMNRMLGGYYQRANMKEPIADGNHSYFEDAETLGGRVARVSGDLYEAHPALLGQINRFKLTGVYDWKIQKLVDSRTVQVISSCLALALSEYEMSNSRANAITMLNTQTTLTPRRSVDLSGSLFTHDGEGGFKQKERLDSHSEGTDDGLSTASKISLTRLQFAVTSIYALREAARQKRNLFFAYLSRTSLVYSGRAVVGEGLDGCSRETLDFLVSFDPDAALLLETSILFEGLMRGLWKDCPMRDLMMSAIATSTTPKDAGKAAALHCLMYKESILPYAVTVNPKSSFGLCNRLQYGQLSGMISADKSGPLVVARGYSPILLQLINMNSFLFVVSWIS